MGFLTDLWLPILLAAVFVFVASSILHMVIPIHKSDYKKMPNEDAVLESMRTQGVTPGTYMFPCASSMKEMGTPEMLKKLERGPVGWITVAPGPFNMGKCLTQWFVFCLIISFFVAYITHLGVALGADYLAVFRVAGATAVLAYALPVISETIWKGQSWSTTFKFMFDGLVYGLVTAGTFAWLWPEIATS